ncbi:MAG: hypothetical protein JWQ97_1134, partial [Phenylobacterium sp.]|nr:hypothetical protein [Phenylobacterium sp.]
MNRSDKAAARPARQHVYKGSVGGWGSVRGMTRVAGAERDLPVRELMR